MMAYVLMALLCAAALLLLTRPWWQRSGLHVARRSANITAYKLRLAELDADVAAGLLDTAAAEQLKQEAGARLLVDADAGAEAAPATGTNTRLWWVMLSLPLFAGAWYALAGSWRTQELIELAQRDPAAAQQQMVDAMVQRLSARLQQQPDDAEGWAMLGRSYSVLQRFADAATAYGRANALSGAQNADWLVGEGEALALSRDRDLQGRPQQLFEAAITLQPGHIGGLWFAGLGAAQAEDFPAAQGYWSTLVRQDIPDEMRQLLEQRLQELARLRGEKPAAEKGAAPAVALQVEVSLAPALQAQLQAGHTLFVFAKAEQGPPMPLAVQKFQPATLPVSVRLDDSMSMLPELKLSQFERWTVTARLTRGGSVQAQSGDLEGSMTLERSAAGKPQRLVIDRQLP